MTLRARGLKFGYPGHVVGQAEDLTVRRGEVFALLGPNGGGKTTLLKTMLGLVPRLGGHATLDEREIGTLPVAERARTIGYVPQSSASPFAFTAREVVLMGRTAHGGLFAAPSRRDREVADGMLQRLDIAHLADRPTNMISGGERQLVLIARALAQEPAFVVLDEPTASLDFGNQGKVMRRVRALANEGLGVLFTTHDPNQALRVAERVALLRDGTIVATGGVTETLTPDALSALYKAPVDQLSDLQGRVAFLPG
jgi:iron complex transport system ATP-binding protein